ncbi:MAG: pyruvate kinase alpha/beta domain-containing protein [bacterium]
MSIEIKSVYFEKPGPKNTLDVLGIVRKRGEQVGIKTILIASSTGKTAVRATEILKGMKIVAVSLSTGFTHGDPQPNIQKFTLKNRKKVEEKGGTVLTMTHAFAGVSRAMTNKFKACTSLDIINHTLKIFGNGMKVACEISMMAADAGLVRTHEEDIIAVAGSGGGADTAIVLQPVISQDFFNLKVKEILCKPHF